MDISSLKAHVPTAALIPTVAVAGLAYVLNRFTTRISPTIPYAGEESLQARLQVPVQYGKDPVEFLRKTRKQLGDVFCVDLFAVKIVFVLGAEGNKDVFRVAEDKLSFWEQIKWAMPPRTGELLDFPGWLPISMKRVKTFFQKQEILDSLPLRCDRLSDETFEHWASEDSVPLFKSVSHLVLAYLLVLLAGEDFYRRHGDELIPLMAKFECDLQQPILRVLPFSLWGLTAPGSSLYRTGALIEKHVDAEVGEILAHPEKHVGREDYLYSLASTLDPRFRPVYGNHLMGMLFAGHANAAMSLPWMLLHARRTPGALARLRAEAVLGPDARRPYLEACLRETGRLYTNTSNMRVAVDDVVVGGHTVPKGTLVACSPAAVQREDARTGGVFGDAARWDPERFLADGAYAGWFQRGEFVQFGMGTHQCPGEKLARLMIFDLVLKPWLERYEMEVVSGLEEGSKGIDGVGAEAAWTEQNFGTPSVRGEDVHIRVRRRTVVDI